MSFSPHFFGPFSSDIRQFVNLPLPHGCVELGFADLFGGILGLSWVERGDFWSITTDMHGWPKMARKSTQSFHRHTRTVHASCVWGQGPYQDLYKITLLDSTVYYETEIRFCPGYKELTGWYSVRDC